MSVKKWLNDHNLTVSAIGASLLVALLSNSDDWFAEKYNVVSPYLRADGAFQDYVAYFGRPAPKDPRIVFLADDSPSHTLDQLWPEDLEASPTLRLMKKRIWSRQIWADVLDRLANAGARVVAFDYMFKGEDDGDPAFKSAIDRHSEKVVLGSHIDDAAVFGQQMPSIAPPAETILREVRDPRVGFINMFPDPDGIVRHMRFRVTLEELVGLAATSESTEFESLAARAARQAGEGSKVPPGHERFRIRYAYKGETLHEETKPISLFTIFVPSYWESNYQNGEFFKDKIVLVGPEGNYTKDIGPSPFGTIAGPEFHLNALNSILTNEFLRATPRWLDFCLIALGGLFGWVLASRIRNAVFRLLLLPLIGFAAFAAAVAAYNAAVVVPIFSPLLVLAGTVVTATAWQQLIERLEKARLRHTFERYVSRDVVKELVDNPESFLNSMVGVRKNVTVLFSDVRGFTTITESGDATQLVGQLNQYFSHMVNLVFANRGTLDKFIGDAVMAQWGGITTRGEKEDAMDAVRTAMQMRERLVDLNKMWIKEGRIDLKVGIGINHGEAIVGNLGCEAKAEISLIGDAVNTASRFEGMTKDYHVDLIVGDKVAALVRDQFIIRTVGLSQPKGKLKPVEIFTVLGERTNGTIDPDWLARYEEGVKLFRGREFAQAAERFESTLSAIPGDWLCETYLTKSRNYAANPPPPEWRPVDVMTSK
jgi:adenylate cyclase